jgi:hypothetical protein
LAFQFLSQADERTSVFHSNLLVEIEKRRRHNPLGGCIPPGSMMERRMPVQIGHEIVPELQGCLRNTVGYRLV